MHTEPHDEDRISEILEKSPAMVQIWTNGKPVPTGTAVPIGAATFRVVSLVVDPDQGILRTRTEIDPNNASGVTSTTDIIDEAKAFEVVAAMCLASRLSGGPSHVTWRKGAATANPASYPFWGQLTDGLKIPLEPAVKRAEGDAVLALAVGLGLDEGFDPQGWMFQAEYDPEAYLCLEPPAMGDPLTPMAGVLFLGSEAETPGTPEQMLFDCAQTKGVEKLPGILDGAWT